MLDRRQTLANVERFTTKELQHEMTKQYALGRVAFFPRESSPEEAVYTYAQVKAAEQRGITASSAEIAEIIKLLPVQIGKAYEIAELPCTGRLCRFPDLSFLALAITDDDICIAIELPHPLGGNARSALRRGNRTRRLIPT